MLVTPDGYDTAIIPLANGKVSFFFKETYKPFNGRAAMIRRTVKLAKDYFARQGIPLEVSPLSNGISMKGEVDFETAVAFLASEFFGVSRFGSLSLRQLLAAPAFA